MSDSYGSDAGGPGARSGTIDAAKQEAADMKDTAAAQANEVLGTAKEEASSVVSEAKVQAKDLYAQTQRELKDQANTQQQRIAFGLRSVGDELDSMAANSPASGLATDIVRQVSRRVSSAAAWLGDRDPGSVLAEVKQYARRKPVTFIVAAAIAGIVVGRLTRALAANASDQHADSNGPRALPQPAAWAPATVGSNGSNGPVEDTPVYAQAAPAWVDGGASTGDGDGRRDSV
jgi:hypothetical protein